MLPEQEWTLVTEARAGDGRAFESLITPLHRPLFAYIYRMIAHRQDAEDALQDVLVRTLESLPSFRREAKFKTWLFGIATHVCLDLLRARRRWRLEAQLEGEKESKASPETLEQLVKVMNAPDFVFEIREHIAFCFACVGRSLEPEEQAALMLREVLGFSNEESAKMLEVSEPVFRHRLSSARSRMMRDFEGLCQLVSKTGACWQCKELRDIAPDGHRGADLVQIEVAPGLTLTAESLLDARIGIVRDADLENGRTAPLHAAFFASMSRRENAAP
jgi:RNA polymerase sigma-70 factor (ECF subfamily)